MFIPIYEPLLDESEKRNVVAALDSGWISSRGAFVDQFEKEFSHAVAIPHATSCTNGTVALHLAICALGIGSGDEVIVPDFGYISVANTVVHAGAKPVFCDVDLETWQICPASAANCITPRTKAIIAVHTYGGVAPMNALRNLADKNGLKLIEDCAEAIGSKYQGNHVGSIGELSAFSFFGNKTITTGEGGMVVSTSAEYIQLVRRLKNQGVMEGHRYIHDIVAYNYRMTNVACAIGCAQLAKLDSILHAKKNIWSRYVEHLAKTPLIPQHFAEDTTPSHWLCCFIVPDKGQSERLTAVLAEQGIETRPGFGVMSQMPMYKAHGGAANPNSVALADSVICLPSYPGLSAENQDVIIHAINNYFGN